MLKGMDLAKQYYEEFGRAAVAAVLADFSDVQAAVGLVGEGSQCFGFDDAISRDHDFAPGFCIWLTEEGYSEAGPALEKAYQDLPDSYRGFRRSNIIAEDRFGVMTVRDFYRRFTGCDGTEDLPGLPQTNMDWFVISESALAAATNGQIFDDPAGTFSRVRHRLLSFYPTDILCKKIAARAAVMSQAGQYNLLRVLKRGDRVAAMLAASRFSEAALSMIYLLNRKYMPFYKWAYRGAGQLPLLSDCVKKLDQLPALLTLDKSAAQAMAFQVTEEICAAVAFELRRQGFSASNSAFLQDHLGDIMDGIEDPLFRGLQPMADCNQ